MLCDMCNTPEYGMIYDMIVLLDLGLSNSITHMLFNIG